MYYFSETTFKELGVPSICKINAKLNSLYFYLKKFVFYSFFSFISEGN